MTHLTFNNYWAFWWLFCTVHSSGDTEKNRSRTALIPNYREVVGGLNVQVHSYSNIKQNSNPPTQNKTYSRHVEMWIVVIGSFIIKNDLVLWIQDQNIVEPHEAPNILDIAWMTSQTFVMGEHLALFVNCFPLCSLFVLLWYIEVHHIL